MQSPHTLSVLQSLLSLPASHQVDSLLQQGRIPVQPEATRDLPQTQEHPTHATTGLLRLHQQSTVNKSARLDSDDASRTSSAALPQASRNETLQTSQPSASQAATSSLLLQALSGTLAPPQALSPRLGTSQEAPNLALAAQLLQGRNSMSTEPSVPPSALPQGNGDLQRHLLNLLLNGAN